MFRTDSDRSRFGPKLRPNSSVFSLPPITFLNGRCAAQCVLPGGLMAPFPTVTTKTARSTAFGAPRWFGPKVGPKVGTEVNKKRGAPHARLLRAEASDRSFGPTFGAKYFGPNFGPRPEAGPKGA